MPKAEESNTVKELADCLNDGRIDVSNVGALAAPAAKVLLRLLIDDAVQQALPANGHHPTRIQVTMTDSVAALATNVKTVRHSQRTLRTIGGVENEKQYTAGMNELLCIVGAPAYHSLHRVMAALHVFAINYPKAGAVSTAASTALTTGLKDFCDHLCSRFGQPQPVLDQLQAKDATISGLEARLQGMQDSRNAWQTAAETYRNLCDQQTTNSTMVPQKARQMTRTCLLVPPLSKAKCSLVPPLGKAKSKCNRINAPGTLFVWTDGRACEAAVQTTHQPKYKRALALALAADLRRCRSCQTSHRQFSCLFLDCCSSHGDSFSPSRSNTRSMRTRHQPAACISDSFT